MACVLRSLPREIGDLSDECVLFLDECNIEEPPEEIVRMGIPAIRTYYKEKRLPKLVAFLFIFYRNKYQNRRLDPSMSNLL